MSDIVSKCFSDVLVLKVLHTPDVDSVRKMSSFMGVLSIFR
jgi:hypothetical protein